MAQPNIRRVSSARGDAPASVMGRAEPASPGPGLERDIIAREPRGGEDKHPRTSSMVGGEPFASARATSVSAGVCRTLQSVRRHEDPMLRHVSPASPTQNQLRVPKAQPSGPRVPRHPGEYVAGAPVRRKHGIKHVLDRPLVDNEREPLEQRQARGLESR